MDFHERSNIINQIISDTIFLTKDNLLYKLVSPTAEQIGLAEFYYQKQIEDLKYLGLSTRESMAKYRFNKGIWTEEHEKQVKDLEKYIEDKQIQLYKAYYRDDEQEKIRKQIAAGRKSLINVLTNKFIFEENTVEYVANTAKDKFLIALCIQDQAGNYLYNFQTYKETKSDLILSFYIKKSNSILSTADYRLLARTEPFRSMWSISKGQVFGKPSSLLSSNQKALVMFSKMYDNVYESTERPNESVVNDDDMLDGWFALERRKYESTRKQKEFDNVISNKGIKDGANEVFVVTKSEKEANVIREMNDLNSRMKMKQRLKAVEEKKTLEEHQLPDVKLELRNQAMRQMAKRGK